MNDEQKNTQNNQSTDSIVNNIANSETREDKHIEGAKQETANFTAMFGVSSEETAEEKEMSKKPITDIPKVLPVKEDNRTKAVVISDEEKKANHQKNFNGDERLIYQIEEEKSGNPIVVVLFFLALIGFVILLPKISKTADFSSLFSKDTATTTEETEEEISDFFNIDSSAVRAKIGDLEMINFVKTNKDDKYTFSFTIQNVSESTYLFDKKYYVVFYNEEKTLYYALIHSYNAIPSKSAENVTLVINSQVYEKATRFRIEEIVKDKYPDVKLNETDGEYNVLTCTYLNDEMKYYFVNNQLMKIKETYSETNEDSNYTNDKDSYKTLSEKYNKIDSFKSTFIELNDGFSLINEIDLHNATDNDIISLKTYRFFSYHTNKNVVNFEAEAQGYTCS